MWQDRCVSRPLLTKKLSKLFIKVDALDNVYKACDFQQRKSESPRLERIVLRKEFTELSCRFEELDTVDRTDSLVLSGLVENRATSSAVTLGPGACIDTSCDSYTSTLATYYSNFIAGQFYPQKCLKYRKSQLWQPGDGRKPSHCRVLCHLFLSGFLGHHNVVNDVKSLTLRLLRLGLSMASV